MPPGHHWLAVLAGLGATAALAAAAVAVAMLVDSEPRRRALPPMPTTPLASEAEAPSDEMASLKRVDHIAAAQLRATDRRLRRCPSTDSLGTSPRALATWRDCARLPLGHLRVGARLDADILYRISERLPPGNCRKLVLGRSNGMRMLAAALDQLVRGWWDASEAGRGATLDRTLAVARTTGDMRHDLRHPGLRVCRPGALDA